MFLALEASTPCPLCAYRIQVLMMGSGRVNKRSLRITGPLLGALRFHRCPECGTDVRSDGLAPRSAYRLVPDDAAKVAAYRMRKWGVESVVGELTEVRVKEAPRGRAA